MLQELQVRCTAFSKLPWLPGTPVWDIFFLETAQKMCFIKPKGHHTHTPPIKHKKPHQKYPKGKTKNNSNSSHWQKIWSHNHFMTGEKKSSFAYFLWKTLVWCLSIKVRCVNMFTWIQSWKHFPSILTALLIHLLQYRLYLFAFHFVCFCLERVNFYTSAFWIKFKSSLP